MRAIRASELKRFRGRAADDYLAQQRIRIERLSPANLQVPLNILWHEQATQVRFLLPVRRGRSYGRILDQVTSLGFLSQVAFEVICADPDMLSVATDRIRRWGRQYKVPVKTFSVPHFLQREHPLDR